MPEIWDLGMSDEEYLQLLAEGRDPIQEKICERNLIRAGVAPESALRAAPLLKKVNRSADEELLVKDVWQQVRS
ncbi:MAG TPA: hypothetical protein V6C63_17635 [Allocoleopsis sp.]